MARNNARRKAVFLTSHMQGLTGTPRRAEERSQLFGGGSCSSLSEALNDYWVTRDTAKRNILRQAAHSSVLAKKKKKSPALFFCSLMHVSSHFCQSPASVTGDLALVHCDRAPVTFGDAGSYDSFRVTPGPGWLIVQATRGQKLRAFSWGPFLGTTEEAMPPSLPS